MASLDLGSPKLAHLLPLMRRAGFSEVFLGIENPDPAALRGMNKKQNTKVDIAATVRTIQRAGIEVMAGFIFGSDEDTVETAEAITVFATRTAIPTAMTGMLTPIPHTPLRERLRQEGRLYEAEFSGSNTTDSVQFTPKRMSASEMQRGYYQILDRLFAPGATFERSRMLLDRLEPQIFHGHKVRPGICARRSVLSGCRACLARHGSITSAFSRMAGAVTRSQCGRRARRSSNSSDTRASGCHAARRRATPSTLSWKLTWTVRATL